MRSLNKTSGDERRRLFEDTTSPSTKDKHVDVHRPGNPEYQVTPRLKCFSILLPGESTKPLTNRPIGRGAGKDIGMDFLTIRLEQDILAVKRRVVIEALIQLCRVDTVIGGGEISKNRV